MCFLLQQSCKLVVIYDDPIGEEDDALTLMFPGDVSGSSPKRVVPERVGTKTLVFDTPGKCTTHSAYVVPNLHIDNCRPACYIVGRHKKVRFLQLGS